VQPPRQRVHARTGLHVPPKGPTPTSQYPPRLHPRFEEHCLPTVSVTGMHCCPAAHVEHCSQDPPWHVSHAGQSQSESQAVPHVPLVSPGRRTQTEGASQPDDAEQEPPSTTPLADASRLAPDPWQTFGTGAPPPELLAPPEPSVSPTEPTLLPLAALVVAAEPS
jgi:hypothetical protein